MEWGNKESPVVASDSAPVDRGKLLIPRSFLEVCETIKKKNYGKEMLVGVSQRGLPHRDTGHKRGTEVLMTKDYRPKLTMELTNDHSQ